MTTSTPRNTPVSVTQQSDGWIFATENKQAGPFTEQQIGELGFDNRVAEELGTTMAEVFKATFPIRGSDERPRLKLRDINASKITGEFDVDGQIVGESDKKAVPKTAHVYCPGCRADETITVTLEQQAALVLEGTAGFQKKLSGTLEDPRSHDERSKHPCHHTNAVILDEPQYADYRLLKLRSPPSTSDDLDPTDLRAMKTYALGHVIPQSKMVRVRARVLIESKTRDIVLVASDTKPLDDEISSFKLTEKDKIDFRSYYSQQGLLQNIDGYFIPRLVGQTLRKQLMYLVLHSPPWIRLPDGTRIRGLLRLLIVGDTKTFKSKSLVWIFDNLRVGEPCFAETSSRTGLLYNIDTDNRMLIWGILPRNDLGLCLIAGFHHIRPEEMEQFREVLEFLRLKVSRVVEGEAHCRTRIIADSNPRRASMKEYVLPCEAIADLPFFSGTPDMTRWDLYFTVKLGDVDQKSIDQASESPLTIPPEVQRRHILWAMSRRVDNIRFGTGTLERVNEINGQIVDKYGSEALPIVHPGFKEVLVRLTTSLAATLHSVDDTHENVIVRPEHVDSAYSTLQAVYDQNLELDKYAAEEKSKTTLTDADLQAIIGKLDDTDVSMLMELRRSTLQSSVLAEKLSLDDSTIRHHAASLKALEMLKSSRGRAGGYELAPKGIRVIRKLMPKEPPKDPTPPGNVNPRINATYSPVNVTKPPQFTDYKGAPPPGKPSESLTQLVGQNNGGLQPPYVDRGPCRICNMVQPRRLGHDGQSLICQPCFEKPPDRLEGS